MALKNLFVILLKEVLKLKTGNYPVSKTMMRSIKGGSGVALSLILKDQCHFYLEQNCWCHFSVFLTIVIVITRAEKIYL